MPDDGAVRHFDEGRDRHRPRHGLHVLRYIQTTTGRNELIDDHSGLSTQERVVLLLCEQSRSFEELVRVVPQSVLVETLESLLLARCLSSEAEFAGLPGEGIAASSLSDAERFRVVIDILTSLAAELPFVARVRIQLRIERVCGFDEALALATEMAPMIGTQHPGQAEVTSRIHTIRRLIASRGE
jgi:hypothetical protein